MKRPEIARSMARRAGVTHAEGADRLDRVVHQLLTSLRKGKPAPLPGLGRFTRDSRGQITFEREARGRG